MRVIPMNLNSDRLAQKVGDFVAKIESERTGLAIKATVTKKEKVQTTKQKS